MTTEVAQQVRLVEVIENEDGDVGWATGHVEPTLMVLSAVAERMVNVDADDALRTLIGRPVTYTTDAIRRWTFDEAMEHAARMLASVEHLWMIPDGENEEIMHTVGEGTPGAEAWTKVRIEHA